MILRAAAAIGAERWTPAEIDQLRRKLLADHGAEGKTGSDYIGMFCNRRDGKWS